MIPFSLDCLTLPDVTPVDLFAVAADAGYGSVSLWVQPPALYPPMLAMPAMAPALKQAIASSGVSLGNLEVFNLNSDAPIADFERVIAFGAELGARSATAINFGGPRADMAERLAAFHALCSQYGLAALLEPISMGATRTVQEGAALAEEAGVDVRIVVDCLHVMRTGTTPESLAQIPAERIGYIQLCDGPAVIADAEIGPESVANRLYPGEGEFPLVAYLKALPTGVPIGVETPNQARLDQGMSPLDRARTAFAAAQAVCNQAGGAQ